MEWCRVIALSLLLVGCAQTSDELVSPEMSTGTSESVAPSCLDELMSINAQTQPNRYKKAFWTCDASINDNSLVRNYVQAMVVTGRFSALHSATVFPSNVDAELASTWADWIERNL
ncbi:hypothetical protein L4C31_01815 [Aliivibrio sifiae]